MNRALLRLPLVLAVSCATLCFAACDDEEEPSGTTDTGADTASGDTGTGDASEDTAADVPEDMPGDLADAPDMPPDACGVPSFTCCQGDVEVSPVCGGGGGLQCPSGFTQAPLGGCVGDVSELDSSDMGGGNAIGEPCGGMAGPCDASGWCDHADNGCGFDDGQGVCVVRPTSCDTVYAPVCGCDGGVHSNDCEAQMEGVDVSPSAGCTPPLDTFACGYRFCAHATEYCRVSISDVGGFADEYTCVALPQTCTPGSGTTCACLIAEPCGTMCEQAADGNLTLTCPGG